jgi:transposase
MAHGHTVRLMAPKFVVPYRLSGKRGKNDAVDAAANCLGSRLWTSGQFKLTLEPARWPWTTPCVAHRTGL